MSRCGADPGQAGGEPGDGLADRGRHPVRVPQDDRAAVRFGVAEQARVGAAEGEHGLVGVAGEDELLGGEAEPGEQAVLERVEVLRVVDQQVADPVPLGGEQLRVGLEGQQRARDQLRGVERGRALLGDGAVRGVGEQRHLLVLAREPAGGHPLRTLGVPAELDEVLGARARARRRGA